MDLIQQYGSIDNLYAKMPDIEAKPAAIRKKLAAGRRERQESYWLATIVTDAPLDFHPEENLCRKPGRTRTPVFEAGVHQADRKVRPAPAEQPRRNRADFTMTVEQVTEPGQAERLLWPHWRSGPCISAGPAGPDGPGCGLPDRGGHRRHGGAVLRQVSGDWNAL